MSLELCQRMFVLDSIPNDGVVLSNLERYTEMEARIPDTVLMGRVVRAYFGACALYTAALCSGKKETICLACRVIEYHWGQVCAVAQCDRTV